MVLNLENKYDTNIKNFVSNYKLLFFYKLNYFFYSQYEN